MYENTLKTVERKGVVGGGSRLPLEERERSLRRERSSEKLKRPSTQRERERERFPS